MKENDFGKGMGFQSTKYKQEKQVSELKRNKFNDDVFQNLQTNDYLLSDMRSIPYACNNCSITIINNYSLRGR